MRALLSVADREGLAPLAAELLRLGVEVFATDGTREALAADGVEVASVAVLTDVPALAGGQVKTFHPAIYAGILARRDRPEQLAELAQHGIGLIDLVVVNIAPFAPQVGQELVPLDEAVERIEVGGAALLSAAARNFAGSTPVSSPQHYDALLADLRERGQVSPELRQQLAADAFATVAAYNAEVAAYLNQISGIRFPSRLTLVLEKLADLPYGENPHQRGAIYRETSHRAGVIVDAVHLQGGPPTFNDLLDQDAAHRIVSDFTGPTAVIVKRANPVGLASSDTLGSAYKRAFDCDPGQRLRRHAGGQPDRRRGDGPGHRGHAVRGGRGARLRRGRPGHPGRQVGHAAAAGPGHARPAAGRTTAWPTWTSCGWAAGCSWRPSTATRTTARSSRS